MKNMKLLIVGIAGFMFGVGTCAAAWVGQIILFPSPSQALPFFSTFSEERQENGFQNDFSYKLKAQVSPEEFRRFVRQMGFPDDSKRTPSLYLIERARSENQTPDYQKRAEYLNGQLHFEEFQN